MIVWQVAEVTRQLHELHRLVASMFKYYTGEVSLLGHSLGGTIVYEVSPAHYWTRVAHYWVLTRLGAQVCNSELLQFVPSHVFYLGSNLGAYSLLYQHGELHGPIVS